MEWGDVFYWMMCDPPNGQFLLGFDYLTWNWIWVQLFWKLINPNITKIQRKMNQAGNF